MCGQSAHGSTSDLVQYQDASLSLACRLCSCASLCHALMALALICVLTCVLQCHCSRRFAKALCPLSCVSYSVYSVLFRLLCLIPSPSPFPSFFVLSFECTRTAETHAHRSRPLYQFIQGNYSQLLTHLLAGKQGQHRRCMQLIFNHKVHLRALRAGLDRHRNLAHELASICPLTHTHARKHAHARISAHTCALQFVTEEASEKRQGRSKISEPLSLPLSLSHASCSLSLIHPL